MKRIPLEIALIKLARKTPLADISELLAELRSSEKKTSEPARVKKVELNTVEKEEPDAPEIEELPAEELSAREISPEKKVTSLDVMWQPLIRALKSEKISVATYLTEGEPLSLEEGVARISFPEKLSFHRESLETEANRQLIEKHLSALLDQEVRVQFESVKELTGKTYSEEVPGVSDESPNKIATESEGVLKSAMDIFGGKIIR
jgi:hypothetical protein